MRHIFTAIAVMTWMAGIVIAKGFWLTLLSIVLPFYAWYLVVERIITRMGW